MIQDLIGFQLPALWQIEEKLKRFLLRLNGSSPWEGTLLLRKKTQRLDSSCSRIINRTVRLDSAKEWGHQEGAKFAPNREAGLQRLPKL